MGDKRFMFRPLRDLGRIMLTAKGVSHPSSVRDHMPGPPSRGPKVVRSVVQVLKKVVPWRP